MRAERCKYLPNCKGRSAGIIGTIPVCAQCQALRRQQAREAAKKSAA